MIKHTVLITGASGGIGYELAKIFAKNGHDLILVARNAEKLLVFAEELRTEYKVQVAAFARDLTLLDQINELYQVIQQEGIFIDFLINNAGMGDFGPFIESDWRKTQYMMQLNMTSLTYLTHLFLQDMKKNGRGRIMNVASLAAFQPGPNMAVYFATKAYVLHFSEALHYELKKFDITVTSLCPGPTQSNFSEAASATSSNLFKSKNIPSAASVAEYGFMAMMQGKRLAIPGIKNKVFAFLARISPRTLVIQIAAMMNRQV